MSSQETYPREKSKLYTDSLKGGLDKRIPIMFLIQYV